MAEHTPTWEVRYIGDSAATVEEDGEWVAFVTNRTAAHKMATAPKLLQALEALLILDDPSLFIDIETAQLFDDAKDAISKAKGE